MYIISYIEACVQLEHQRGTAVRQGSHTGVSVLGTGSILRCFLMTFGCTKAGGISLKSPRLKGVTVW